MRARPYLLTLGAHYAYAIKVKVALACLLCQVSETGLKVAQRVQLDALICHLMKAAKGQLNKRLPHPTQAAAAAAAAAKQVPQRGAASSIGGSERKLKRPPTSPVTKTLRSPTSGQSSNNTVKVAPVTRLLPLQTGTGASKRNPPLNAAKRAPIVSSIAVYPINNNNNTNKQGPTNNNKPNKLIAEVSVGNRRPPQSPAAAATKTLRRDPPTNQTNPNSSLNANPPIKSADHYRKQVFAVTSPSQLSFKSITEHYELSPSKSSSVVSGMVSQAPLGGGGGLQDMKQVFRQRGYLKQAKIDEGAFGVVSKVMRLSDRTIFAVKEVDLSRKRLKRIEEMKRELFMLQRLESEFVVKLIEHFIVDQTLVIIMEYCAGNNLTAYLKDTAINEQEARHLFIQMALSIKILHKHGFAHRDVKLNNFLLDGTRKFVKISDFGLSVVSFKRGQGIFNAKTYCGTEPYMAPEILRRNSLGLRSYNPIYSDIWSLGICLFAMLTRTFPFKQHNSQQGLFKAQVNCRWKFPKNLRDILSDEIKDLVWHMLDPNPERRITINGILAHPWLNQNQLYVLSPEENTPTLEKRPPQRASKYQQI